MAKPGAKARDIENSLVGTLNKIDKNRLVVVKLAVGVNNFTVKYKNRYGENELRVGNQTPGQIFQELVQVKYSAKQAFRGAVVSYCTIPPINLFWYYKYKQIAHPSYTETELLEVSEEIRQRVQEVNDKIYAANKIEQSGIIPVTPSLHTSCIKTLKNGKKRLIASALYDGIHGTDSSVSYWMRRIRRAALEEIRRLNNRQ